MSKEFKQGDIILFKPGGDFFTKLIAWGTKSPYCHVAVCVSPQMHLAIEANTTGGVRAVDLRTIKEDIDIFRIKPEHTYDADGVISFLVTQLNNKYDFAGVFFLGFLKTLSLIKIPTKDYANKFQKDRDYFCSELCCEAFSNGGGLDIVPQVDDADVTAPGDIAKSGVVVMV